MLIFDNATSKFIIRPLFILIQYRTLIYQLTRREIVSRFKGAKLGVFWNILEPFLTLIIYTIFLSTFMKARWDSAVPAVESIFTLPLNLFAGLIWYNFFSESIIKSADMIRANTNLVKKVVFPLEILPWVIVLTGYFNVFISFIFWVFFCFVAIGSVHLSSLFFVLLGVPFSLFMLGLVYIFSSLCAYFRDLAVLLRFINMAVMFISPIFYSLNTMPPKVQKILMLNPLTFIIESSRNSLLSNQLMNATMLTTYFLISMVVAWVGFIWFQKVKIGFADVI